MSSKELILIILAILIAGCIVACAVFITFNDNDNGLTNNTTAANNTTNITANNTISTTPQSSQNQQSEEYTYDPQSGSYVRNSGEDYATDSYDSEGNRIYAHRWVGDDGVIYENYYSDSGPISTDEYYN